MVERVPIEAIFLDTPRMKRRDVPEAPPLPDRFYEDARRIMARYPKGRERSALMSLLYLVQSEHGYVSPDGIDAVASLLGLTKAEVTAVVTFYTMFKRTPQGTWLFSVCTQPSCTMNGGGEILKRLEEELGVDAPATTDDGLFSIEEVECLCACDGAPVWSINWENYERLDVEQVLDIVRRLRAGEPPPPGARGDVPAVFATACRRLTGIEGRLPLSRQVVPPTVREERRGEMRDPEVR